MKLVEDGEEGGCETKNCQECNSRILDGGMWQSTDIAAVSESPRATVSSDDDDDDDCQHLPHVSPSKGRLLHPRHARRLNSARGIRPSHNTVAGDTSPKDRGLRVEGRRSNIKFMDVRLLESTGISSADSDGEAARLSPTKSASTPKASNTSCVVEKTEKLCLPVVLFVLCMLCRCCLLLLIH